MKHTKLKYGSVATLLVVLAVAGFVLVNLLAGALTDRFYLKLDMTREKLYEISDETKAALAALSEPVTIYVLCDEAEMTGTRSAQSGASYDFTLVGETLRKYVTLANGNISLKYIDPDVNAALVQKYNEAGDLTRYGIVVAGSRRYKTLHITELFTTESQTDPYGLGYVIQQTTGAQLDQAFISAILTATLETVPRAVFTQGHGETPAHSLRTLFEKANYICEDINLQTQDLPEDTAFLIINAPSADFVAGEIDKLDAYFAATGKAMVFFNLDTPALPVLERYLAEWGVAFEQKLVMDSGQNHYVQRQDIIVANMLEHEITASFFDGQFVPLSPMTRPIASQWLTGEKGSRKLTPLLYSSAEAYARAYSPDTEITDYNRQEDDEQTLFILAALSEQKTYGADNRQQYAGIFAASAMFASDTMLEMAQCLNSKLMTSVIGYMNPQEASVVIQPKAYDLAAHYLSENINNTVFFILLVVLIPLLFLGGGFLVWRRRRHL